METSNRKFDVCGYNEKVTTKAVTIGSTVTLAKADNGAYFLIHVNEGLLMETGRSLISSNQVRNIGHITDDVPNKFGGTQSMQTADGYTLTFKITHAVLLTTIYYPNDEDMMKYDVVDITSE